MRAHTHTQNKPRQWGWWHSKKFFRPEYKLKERYFTLKERYFALKERSFALKERYFTLKERSFALKERSFALKERYFALKERYFALKERYFRKIFSHLPTILKDTLGFFSTDTFTSK